MMNQDHHENEAGVTIKLCFNSLRFSFCIAKPHFRQRRSVERGKRAESDFFTRRAHTRRNGFCVFKLLDDGTTCGENQSV